MKSKVPVFHAQMSVRGLIGYDVEFGDAQTAIARARDIAIELGAREVERGQDLVRLEINGIAVRAYEVPAGAEVQEQAPSYRSQLRGIEEAAGRYLEQAKATGLGFASLVPVPRPKQPLLEVGRYVVFRSRRSETIHNSKYIGKIESVSDSGKSVDVSGVPFRSSPRVNVGDIYASFRHRTDAEAVVEHQCRTQAMVDYLGIARDAGLTELIDDAE